MHSIDQRGLEGKEQHGNKGTIHEEQTASSPVFNILPALRHMVPQKPIFQIRKRLRRNREVMQVSALRAQGLNHTLSWSIVPMAETREALSSHCPEGKEMGPDAL